VSGFTPQSVSDMMLECASNWQCRQQALFHQRDDAVSAARPPSGACLVEGENLDIRGVPVLRHP